MVNARVVKFDIQIPHEKKKVYPIFFSCPSCSPFLSYVPLKPNFEKDISKCILATGYSILVYWLGLKRSLSGSPDLLSN